MVVFSRFKTVFLLLAVLPLSACLFRTHKVEQSPTFTLKTATKGELVSYINSQAIKIQSMQATVDIDTAVGGAKKGKVTEYQQIRGYVLARKPAMLRMIGLMPILRNTAFDMVSDGREFKVSIPPKNRFVVGRNDLVTPNPQQPLENLRPQVIYDALLLREIDPSNEVAVLENGTETVAFANDRKFEEPDYVVDVIRSNGNDSWLSRKIVFSRVDLLPNRQLIYDASGTLVTDAHYGDYQDYNAVIFPSRIEIWRPEEEYKITLGIVKMTMNLPLANEKFALEQPPGAQVIHLDANPPAQHGGGSH